MTEALLARESRDDRTAGHAARVRAGDRKVELSVVIPCFDEEGNVATLIAETVAALATAAPYEILCVDDCSVDRTLERLCELAAGNASLRVLIHGVRRGQSAAIRTGVKAARGDWIVTLDGDGQNDPADIPTLLARRETASPRIKLFAGWRVERKDSGRKRWASRWANRIRAAVLRDRTPDTGCGIKLFEREAYLDLPYFDHMHRYLPALMQRAGWQTTSVPVRHRPRLAGRSKYDNLSRAIAGLYDLVGVTWLLRRSSVDDAREMIIAARRERA